jgi:hypothetical protein
LLSEQLKVAVPAVAVTVLLEHVSTPLAGLLPIANVIEAEEDVTTFPKLSSTEAAVAKVAPTTEVGGGVVNPSFVAVPAVTVSDCVSLASAPAVVIVGVPDDVSP